MIFFEKNMNFNIFVNSDPLLGIYVTHSESQIDYKLSCLSRLAPLWTVCSLVYQALEFCIVAQLHPTFSAVSAAQKTIMLRMTVY